MLRACYFPRMIIQYVRTECNLSNNYWLCSFLWYSHGMRAVRDRKSSIRHCGGCRFAHSHWSIENGLPLMCNHANVASFEGTANSSVLAVTEKFVESCSRNVKNLQECHRRRNSHLDHLSWLVKFDIISAIWQIMMSLWGTR